eukprot:1426930-Rhodomonas_salina.1
MSHGRKCWLVYSPLLNTIFASRNVTFDDTLYPMKDRDQRVYGYYDNEAVTQMRADAYGDAIFDSLIQDILCMPLPGTDPEPETADIDDCFEPFDDAAIHDNAIST